MATRPEVTGRKVGRKLLDYPALKARGIPWSRVHLARLEATGKFPLHVDIGENSIAWFEDEVDDFLEMKAAERDATAAARAAKAGPPTTDKECPPRSEAQLVAATGSDSADRRLKSKRLTPGRTC